MIFISELRREGVEEDPPILKEALPVEDDEEDDNPEEAQLLEAMIVLDEVNTFFKRHLDGVPFKQDIMFQYIEIDKKVRDVLTNYLDSEGIVITT
jgi:hypothetical protein